MTIKKIEEAPQSPQSPDRYIDEFYVDAVTDKGVNVKILDIRRTRTITVTQLENERDSYQTSSDLAQSKLDEITVLESE